MEQAKRREDVVFSEFLEFLELQAAEAALLLSHARSARPQPAQGRGNPKRPVLLLSPEKEPSKEKRMKEREGGEIPLSRTACPHPQCDQFHPPYRCQKFLTLSLVVREKNM